MSFQHICEFFMDADPAISRISVKSLARFYALLHYLTVKLYIAWLPKSNRIRRSGHFFYVHKSLFTQQNWHRTFIQTFNNA